MSQPTRVAHIITTLDVGGAEIMLQRLLSATDLDEFPSTVIVLKPDGPIQPRIEALGVPVHCLGVDRERPTLKNLIDLVRLLEEGQYDVIQTWLYHADLMGGVAAWLAGRIPVAWGIHTSTLPADRVSTITLFVRKLLAWASHVLPGAIVCVSDVSRRLHIEYGYDPSRMVMVPNGFNLEEYAIRPELRPEVRAELGIPEDVPVVIAVARCEPQKDYPNLVAAAATTCERLPDAHFVCCGKNVAWETPELGPAIDELGLREHFHLLGVRSDVPRLLAASDVLVSASAFGEAMPLVVGEAMACGVPCVVTDVGDSAMLVGPTGRSVPPREPVQLGHALADVLSLPREERAEQGRAARAWIESRYSLESTVQRYQDIWMQLIARSEHR